MPTNSKPSRPKPTTNAPADLDKLPERFKRYIRELESRVESLERLLPPPTPTNTAISTYTLAEKYQYLPKDSRIVFFTDPTNQYEHLEVFCRRDGGPGIEIYGSDAIDLRGNSSNVVYARIARR